MNAAASVGDMTSHGTPLSPGPGSQNVMASGKPLWRVGLDFHACPIADPRAHVGGAVLFGARTVMLNGFPLASQGDLVVEVGIMNAIVTGNPNLT